MRFTNRKAVEFCLKNRGRLIEIKNHIKMNLRFYESLCSSNEEIIKVCFKLKKHGVIQDYYIRNGFVKLIKKEGERPFKIHHPDILYDNFSNFSDEFY